MSQGSTSNDNMPAELISALEDLSTEIIITAQSVSALAFAADVVTLGSRTDRFDGPVQ